MIEVVGVGQAPFEARDVLGDLLTVRTLMERRVARIEDVGGDPTVTLHHIAALRRVEALLGGRTDADCLIERLRELCASAPHRRTLGGSVLVSHAELFRLLDYHAPECR